jgi:hypothetical protein
MSEEGEDLMLAQLRATNSLAAWEALDQVLSLPSSDVWVQALQHSLQAKHLDITKFTSAAIIAGGDDITALWDFLERSKKFKGYAAISGDALSDFRASALGTSLRTSVTLIRVFRSVREAGSELDFLRAVSRMALVDIRFRRRFVGPETAVSRAVERANLATFSLIDRPFELSVADSLRLSHGESSELQTNIHFYLWQEEGPLVALQAHPPEDSIPEGKIAAYSPEHKVLSVEVAHMPEGTLIRILTGVEMLPDGTISRSSESQVVEFLQPQVAEPVEPIGELSEEEQSHWEAIQALVEIFTRSSSRSHDWRQSKDAVTGWLVSMLREHTSADVSEYAKQVCAGFLLGRLGYLDTETEHESSPRSTSYREYLVKEVENALKRIGASSPKAVEDVGYPTEG